MRESFGGAFVIKLLVVFIIFYTCFMAVALNYAKAFRVKNGVINLIEQYQYDGTSGDMALNYIRDYLDSVSYNHINEVTLQNACYDKATELQVDKKDVSFANSNGACIIPLGGDNKYYRVITYIPIYFPFFGLEFYVSINGETKIIHVS